ncbi:MAG: hypothetical protein WBK76_05560 [Candidatus Saccharimonadales bacterium]
MSEQKVVSIGGIDYDSYSGMPVQKQAATVQKELRRVQSLHAKGIHSKQQRSHALNRQFVKKAQAPVKPTSRPAASAMDVRRPINTIKRSPQISKFAKDPQVVVAKRTQTNVAARPHPVVQKVHAKHPATASAQKHQSAKPALSSTQVKHAAIGKALAHASAAAPAKKKQPKRSAFNVVAASLGVLLIASYFTYVNMPNLSVRVAAAQAGIEAAYPEYRPVGYTLNGPVSFRDGQVSMKFRSNSSPVAFALNQSGSSWDSSALLEKYVNPRSNGQYATYSDGGLTIYTYGTNAAWVNGGILYTVEGDANLSNEQIRRLATSM